MTMYSAQSKSTMLFLCRLYSLTKSKFMIRSHLTATVSDVDFSPFVHNHGFCFLQAWCPSVFVLLGHRVLLTFGLQDTLYCRVLKKCATLLHVTTVYAQYFLQYGFCWTALDFTTTRTVLVHMYYTALFTFWDCTLHSAVHHLRITSVCGQWE